MPTRDTPVDRIADRHLDQSARLDPIFATNAGLAGYDAQLPDLSPDGVAARTELARSTLAALDAAEPQDDTDRVTVAALRERLGVELEWLDAGEPERDVNNIHCAVQDVRSVFDLMRTESAEDWRTVLERLRAVPQALGGYRATLQRGAEHGRVAARRQLDVAAGQCAEYAAADGFFAAFAAGAPPAAEPVRADLTRAADAAAAAYAELAGFLRTVLHPLAPEQDAVGRERYAMDSRLYLGSTVDLDETYEWGLDEVARIEAEMAEVADRIVPGADVAGAVEALDADPERAVRGTAAFRDWMQALADRSVAELAGTHFDIPEPVRRLECRIAPTTSGGIYYTPPSEDFSRPGAMWWAVPAGVTDFSTWREVTTVYHEGVPGHHLQCGQTAYRADTLNRWRRLGCWVSGHGEGWALYAERLMAELGYLDDPGERLGMLDGQGFRAARVVVDIGVHLQLPAPAEVGGGTWDADKAWQFLRAHTRVGDAVLRFELNRYLGWPGQAPSYKIGERIWTQLRADVERREGDAFDVVAFHRRALDIGSVGLDVLRSALLDEAV